MLATPHELSGICCRVVDMQRRGWLEAVVKPTGIITDKASAWGRGSRSNALFEKFPQKYRADAAEEQQCPKVLLRARAVTKHALLLPAGAPVSPSAPMSGGGTAEVRIVRHVQRRYEHLLSQRYKGYNATTRVSKLYISLRFHAINTLCISVTSK
jgi:hypothetical protein